MPRQLAMVLPSTATAGSLMLGVLAIMVLGDGQYILAALFITFGSILDVLDGQLANRLNAISDLGKELDSLADMITFGVAPALFLYHLMLTVGVSNYIAALSTLIFVLSGAIRLARFNTLPTDREASFKGLPIPMASILLISASFWQLWILNIWWTIAVITVSYLMVSPFPYPKSKHIFELPPPVWAGVACLALAWGIVAGWLAIPFGLFLLYALSGPLIAIYTRQAWRFNQG